ncbi:helix-turn-helix domain-containing protein [Paenibacillus sp. J5C_2022]|uniref:helix-turn-helix domain-containing protein n=1 Tax=Paenibacillus sp. J5C2022 TaxID=2977129 RepID=UPI0021D1F02A|nr:helix-turn-helix domain-containing protein [Paenibacillus sp. J5C2022]MCU6712031.1 helix-turn-helix domain-containing protein [Paenibacillus sp. J5C2022]
MNKSWFYRMLLSYLPIFFMTTTMIILLAFLAMNEMNRNAIIKSNEISARQTAAIIDNTLHAIERSLMKEIEHSEEISRFFDPAYRSDTYLSIFGATQIIDNMIASESIIDSIYFYRNADRVALTTKGVLPYEQFGDNGFLAQVLNEEVLTYNWTGNRSFREFQGDGQPRQVVSLVRKVPLLTGADGYIVTNVSMKSLHRLIKEMSYPQSGFIHVYDRNDQLLISYSEAQNHAGDERQPSAGGNEWSAFRSDYTGWDFRSGIRTESWLSWIYSFSSFWIMFGLLTVIAGFIWMIVATRRNYKPIESILGRIHTFSQINMKLLMDRGEADELKFIESSVENLMEQTTKYQRLHEDDLIFRRRYFFQEVMEGTRPVSIAEWKSQAEELGLEHGFVQMAVFIVEIDNYTEFCEVYSNKDQYLLKFVISSVAQEVGVQRNCHVWKEWIANDQLAVLVLYGHEAKDDDTTDIGRKLKQWVDDNLNFSITIGIGSCVRHIADLPESYGEAAEVLRFKSSLGSNKVLGYEEVNRKPRGEAYACLRLIDSLVQSFGSGNQWEDKFNEWFQALEDRMYSFEEIANQMNYMMYGFERKFQRLSSEYAGLWKEEALPTMERDAGRLESIHLLKEQFRDTLERLAEGMEGLKAERSNYRMIMEVKQYLEQHFANPELSLNLVSERFGLHPSYLSRVFKEEMGENFIDCLLHIRMEHARSLLGDTELSVQNVANQVGYMRSISFIRVFKKVNGMTPGDFRKEIGTVN